MFQQLIKVSLIAVRVEQLIDLLLTRCCLLVPDIKVTYQVFFWVLIDLIIELLDLSIKRFDNQTDIFRDLGLIIKPFDNQAF